MNWWLASELPSCLLTRDVSNMGFCSWPVSYSEPGLAFHLLAKFCHSALTLDAAALGAAPPLSYTDSRHPCLSLPELCCSLTCVQFAVCCVLCELILVIKIKTTHLHLPPPSQQSRQTLSLKCLNLVNWLLFNEFWEPRKDKSLFVYVLA